METPAKVQIGGGNRTVKTEIIFQIETRFPNARGRIHTDIGIDAGEEPTYDQKVLIIEDRSRVFGFFRRQRFVSKGQAADEYGCYQESLGVKQTCSFHLESSGDQHLHTIRCLPDQTANPSISAASSFSFARDRTHVTGLQVHQQIWILQRTRLFFQPAQPQKAWC